MVKPLQARARLQRLNALLALSQADWAERARDVRAAIDATLADAESCSDDAFNAAIETLRRLHAAGAAFAYVDVSQIAWGPLWVEDAVRRAMRPITGYKDAVLVVSGLGDFLRPPSGRWSRACRADYESIRQQVESVAASMCIPKSRLRILFI